MRKYTNGLNDSQKQAVLHNEGPLLVLAGAGSGKTRVLTNRIARLVHEKRCAPSAILAVTFTNKAAREMKERIASLSSAAAAAEMTICTFHSLGARILREDGEAIGLRTGFTIMDDHQRQATIKELLRSTSKQHRDKYDELGSRISLAKNASLDPDAYGKHNPDDRTGSRLYQAYHARLLKRQSVDFDDLLLLPLQLLRGRPTILAKYRARYSFLSIDEFQDTNAVQMELCRLLAAPKNNIMAVGDDDQGIYSWRGANIDNIINFASSFKGCVTVVLDRNYRSTQQILEGAHAVVANNRVRKHKTIIAAAGPGEPIRCFRADDETEEAEWIGRTMKRHVERSLFCYRDHALLFRTNAMMRRFEEELRRQRIPYHVQGAMSFFDRREIKDVLAYCRFFANSDDELSLGRVLKVPNKGFSPAVVRALEDLAGQRRMSLWDAIERHDTAVGLNAAQHRAIQAFVDFCHDARRRFANGPLSAALRHVLTASGYLALLEKANQEDQSAAMRLENVEEIVHGLEVYEQRRPKSATLAGYVQELTLVVNDNPDEKDQKRAGAILMTLHKAKGLEFPVVFMPNLDDSVIPSPRSVAEGNIAEERRLFYVGMTRAQKRLFLTWPRTKVFRKKTVEVAACRFIREIPETCLDGRPGEREEAEREAFAEDFFARMRQSFNAAN